MKKVLLVFSAISVLSVTSCEKKTPVETTEKQDVATATEQAMMYDVNTVDSNVEWRGFKVYEGETEEQGHHGFMKLQSGTISYENDIITAGDFVIDVASIESVDLNDSPDDKEKLDGHLKSEDFLDVANYPTATFTITEVSPLTGAYNSQISGNFKMRDIEKNISFKANVILEDHVLKINTEDFTIDRQEFGITFKGKGAVIKDNVVLRANIIANHKM
ncbi:YceI family protein [Weeksellaceae bacterium TAE3-ERU29]|nr:YceI family protein [Weeksellaceae bacterium TAE3-ERU29]